MTAMSLNRVELDQRQGDSLTVTLYLDDSDVVLSVVDEKEPANSFERVIDGADAKFAFEHPSLFAPVQS